MKHIPTTLLPALALLTLGGCATSNGLTTTESDGVYYSSKDRTTEVAVVAAADEQETLSDDPDALANPDYRDGRTRSRGTSSDEYYSDDFDYSYYARQRRYTGLGMGYGLGYTDPYWYNPRFNYYDPFLYSYSPYGYSAWNDPFWGPSWYGGTSISFNIGWGRGGWGPWGPGYGYGYNPWGYNRGYWDGYYSGLYGGGFYNGGYWDGYRGGGRNVNYRVAPRNDRSVEVVGSNRGNNGGGRPRVDEATGGRALNTPTGRYSRGRVEDAAGVPSGGGRSQAASQATNDVANPGAPGRGRLYRIVESSPNAPAPGELGGVKPATAADGQPQLQQAGTYEGTRRRRFYNDQQPNLSTSDGSQSQQGAATPRPRRERYADAAPQQYEQPTRRERSYEQPTRSYEQPTRSYEQPSRSSDGGGRNFGGGSNSGGGSSSGSGGGGGGRGRVQ